MALKEATRTGGEYLDLKELAANGPVTVIFRIVEFLPQMEGDFGPMVPVIADALICSGPRKGEVWLSEKFIGAATATLRGVRNPKRGERAEPPVNQVGDEIISRVEVIQRGKGQPFAALNVPSEADKREALEVYADGRGWNATPQADDAAAAGSMRPF